MRHIFLQLIILAFLSSCSDNVIVKKKGEPITLHKTWVLDSASIFPVIIPSFYDSLYKGALLTFTEDNKFIVLKNGDTCGQYHYIFDSSSNIIKVTESDMIFEFDSVDYLADRLTFKDNFTKFPDHTVSQHLFIISYGNKLYFNSYE